MSPLEPSRLMHALAGFAADASTVPFTLNGVRPAGPDPSRVLLLATAALLPWMTALENVRLAVEVSCGAGAAGASGRRAMAALEQLGVASNAAQRPGQLDVATQHRVALARAVAVGASTLLLDAPFVALDAARRAALHDSVRALARSGKAVVLVAQDPLEALAYCDRIEVVTSQGRQWAVDVPPEPADQQALAARLHEYAGAGAVAVC